MEWLNFQVEVYKWHDMAKNHESKLKWLNFHIISSFTNIRHFNSNIRHGMALLNFHIDIAFYNLEARWAQV